MNLFRLSENAKAMQASEIRELMKLASKPGIITFAGGNPDGNSFPVREVTEIINQWTEIKNRNAFQYGATTGNPHLLDLLHKRMLSQNISMEGQKILVTTGAQQSLYLLAKALINPGDKIIAESPSFIGAIASFKSLRADIEWAPLEDDGVFVTELEKILRRLVKEDRLPKFIYTIPNFQNPAGLTLSQEKRKALLQLALEYGVPILEDDPYGELRFRGEAPPPLAALDDAGLVVRLGTFSKTLAPGMRIGWLVGPPPLVAALATARQAADLHTATLAQRATALLLSRFDYDGHVQLLRRVYGERCLAMLDALGRHLPAGSRWTIPEGGLFTWVTLPPGLDATALFTAALREKVAFVPGATFYAADPKPEMLRLNYSNRSPELIEEGMARLGRVLHRP